MAFVSFSIIEFIIESNKIEGIFTVPTDDEIQAYNDFLRLNIVTVNELKIFVSKIQPGAVLRNKYGMNVRVGNHTPISGGPGVEIQLRDLLDGINYQKALGLHNSFENHVKYETLHPFSDGNGRSGRVLWLWEHGGILAAPLGFLHTFYYEILSNSRRLYGK